MDTVGKIIAIIVIVIYPFVLLTIESRFDSLDEKIMKLKRRINKLDEEIGELKKRISKLESKKD